MKLIQSKQTVGSDGHIRLDIPAGRAGDEVEVVVVFSDATSHHNREDWRGFVQQMAGACPDLEAPADPPAPPLKESL